MKKTVTLADIAKPLGVSNVTVSKALSGQKGVSEELRAKIYALADELGYKQVSHKDSKNTSYNIGVLIHERHLENRYDSFYQQMYQCVNLRATSKGCFSQLEAVSSEMEKNFIVPQMVVDQRAHGIIIIGQLGREYVAFLSAKGRVPYVFLDFSDYHSETDAVVSDSYYGAYTLTKYLIEKGHRDIAYVGTVSSTASITDRYFGYLKALMEHGIKPREEWKIDDRYLDTGKVDEENLLRLPEHMPTAFFCNCDIVGGKLVRKLENAGYRVPEDISVVGYDNYLYPGVCDVELTTYEVDIKEMARKAVNHLLKKMAGENIRKGIRIVEGHLVEKQSVREIKSN